MSDLTSRIRNQRIATFQSSLRNDLNNSQKRAIIAALFVMIGSKESTSEKEIDFIELIASLLDIDMTSSYFTTMIEEEEITKALNTLDRAKKEWLLTAFHTLTMVDGKIEEIESIFLIGFASDMGISRSELNTLIRNIENRI
jgi:uncharacterized tellurite resistance protein B-like protein